jgi:hypothetical protein
MPRCSNGHNSTTDDYCDICGVPIGAPARQKPVSSSPPAAQTVSCGSCGQPMLAGARFCELCGWDAEAAKLGANPSPPPDPEITLSAPPATEPPLPPATGWHVVVAADRSYFDTVLAMEGADASELSFPTYWPERRFPLAGPRVVIGRRSRSRGTEPDIDLGGQFADPGVSHLHAMLVAQPGGTWTVIDLGSSNGTYLNDEIHPIRPNVPVSVGDGDEIHVGAWTTLTVRTG